MTLYETIEMPLTYVLYHMEKQGVIVRADELKAYSDLLAEKIEKLQKFITDNYYTCTNEILKGLGEMYVNDERMKRNIDKAGGEGTTEFARQAILVYCSK